jgi:hypothetical protein
LLEVAVTVRILPDRARMNVSNEHEKQHSVSMSHSILDV